MRQPDAKLRACGSCEWIWQRSGGPDVCPKCGFASYGARYLYDNKAYIYAKTQQPWYDRKMAFYAANLRREIRASNERA